MPPSLRRHTTYNTNDWQLQIEHAEKERNKLFKDVIDLFFSTELLQFGFTSNACEERKPVDETLKEDGKATSGGDDRAVLLEAGDHAATNEEVN